MENVVGMGYNKKYLQTTIEDIRPYLGSLGGREHLKEEVSRVLRQMDGTCSGWHDALNIVITSWTIDIAECTGRDEKSIEECLRKYARENSEPEQAPEAGYHAHI